jgi:hypothetical protein
MIASAFWRRRRTVQGGPRRRIRRSDPAFRRRSDTCPTAMPDPGGVARPRPDTYCHRMETGSSEWISLPDADDGRSRHRTDPSRPGWTLCERQLPDEQQPVPREQAGFPCARCSARFTALAPIGMAPLSAPASRLPRQRAMSRQPARVERRSVARTRSRDRDPGPPVDPPRRPTIAKTSANPWRTTGWVILEEIPGRRVVHQPYPGLRLRVMCGRRFLPTATIWLRRPSGIPSCRECSTIRAAALAERQAPPRTTPAGRRRVGDVFEVRLQVVRGGLPGLGRRR